ncbi:C-terminal binding protein [Caldimonas brevitalea]|uniref:C-terminal binding protein n=1 Tax=Caldimonas brevitalea TaxID=413882 RepID=UPI0009FB1671|nr:C-terminal binding protein [Caldimonas brevitalea]
MANIYIVDSIYEHHFQSPEVESLILPGHDIALKHISTSADLEQLPLESIDVLLLWACVPSITINQSILNRLEQCRAIIKVAVGFENIDLQQARRRNIDVFNVPDYGTEEVADHALALLLSMARKINYMDRATKMNGWSWAEIKPTYRLRGRTLGIIGFGRIGGAVARRVQPFGMKACFYDPYVPSGIEKTFGVVRCENLNDLIEESDCISIHCALNDSSHHLLGREQFARMKHGTLVINTARGGIVDSSALLQALNSGIVAMAGLDVLEGEPALDARFRDSGRVILTAHSAFYSEESFREMRETSATMAKAVLSGTKPRNIVN